MLTDIDFYRLSDAYIAAHPAGCLYCLVDHAGMPGLHRKLVNTKAEWISLFDGTKEANALSVAPLLFRIAADHNNLPHRNLLSWIGEHGTYTSSMLLLGSPLPLHELARRLTLRLDATVSEEMDVLLRYFDPRIFEQLVQVLTDPQKQAFLSVADRWWWLDRRGEMREEGAQFAAQDLFESPLVLSAGQEVALLDASEPDQVAGQLLSGVPDSYLLLPLPQRHDFILRHIAQARLRGIDSTHELTLYCALALCHGDDFAAHPQWDALLGDVQAGRTCLTEALIQTEITT